MKADVRRSVAKCEVYQHVKYDATSLARSLQSLSIPPRVWEDISLDFILGLPKVACVDTTFVVIDGLTKYDNFIVLRHPFTTKDVDGIFVQKVARLHGYPRISISNNDRLFLSNFSTKLLN